MRFRYCIIALFGALLLFIAPQLAQAEENAWRPIDEGLYQITVAEDGSAIDVTGASTAQGANVGFYSANASAAQKWSVAYEADGTARLSCVCSGLALSAQGSAAGANVAQTGYDGQAQQRWIIEVQDDGTYKLISAANSSLALTKSGDNAVLTSQNAQASQRLEFTPVAPLSDGIYTLTCGNSDVALDVNGSSTDPGANVQLYSANRSQAQKWYVARQDDGTYTFESLCSGLALTADGAGSGANVCQRSAGTLSRFYLEPTTGGAFTLRLKGTDNVVDVNGAVFSSGTNVQIWERNGSPAQRFRPVPCEALASGYYTIAPADNLSCRWDVDGASVAAGANLQLWGTNGGYAQAFSITATGSGVYEIRLCGVDRVIAPKGGSAAANTNIEVATPSGSNNQRWRFTYAGGGSFAIVSAGSGLYADIAGGHAGSGANLQIALPNHGASQRFRLFSSPYIDPPIYHGFQNPAGYYQVSDQSVWFPHVGEGMFGYRTESRISKSATKNDCIETMITRAYEYLGTPYHWDYACAPGVGVDCAGLVLQALYATGMDLSPMNPWDHYYTPGHDHYAVWMAESSGFQHVSFAERQRGDLIFYSGHVAIYLGNDTIIEGTGPGVIISSIYRPGTIIGVGRVYI